MKAHPIRICRRHTICRWIRHHVIATPRISTIARPRVEWERAYDPQAWILGVLPLIAFTNIIWDDASNAVEEIEKSDSPLSGFVETDQWAAIHWFAFLVNFLEKKDPQHESQAYKALAECDPGFKKIEMAGLSESPLASFGLFAPGIRILNSDMRLRCCPWCLERESV
ncbi:hypothetical protein FCULG_00011720 [Fusarium culmorum]|uniref:Uncharacterized protein n=1 Tax=Fusarium culmorum TaxID=5516 RepID=A0A2T4GRU0_FUSCU|nr:hypothetical protein FCULG_00011720 [Fusarium culmorum]